MSLEAVQMIIGRAATDPEFRKLLIENAARACEGYDLTEEELAALEELDGESLEAFVGTLPPRISKGAGSGFAI
ncbi:MAG: Franean1_4349 family RiPP [Anaerolineae bacterium]|nr:MAG: Franean1_4349 family RiPP [Anaerolineae bacterium]